jgi:hypothetical protein
MLIEEVIFHLIPNKITKNGNSISYDDLTSWRQQLLEQLDESKTIKSQQLQFYTEKLMSEYYFLNNIIPGIIVASIILLLLPPANVGPINFTVASSIIALSLLLLIWFIWLIFITMGNWLKELYALQNNKPPRRKR